MGGMDQPSFDDALDWIAAREGESVYLEVGIADPTLPDSSFYPVAQHATLGKVRLGEDVGHDGRGLAVLPFSGGERNRMYLDSERVTGIIVNHAGLKITFHDSIYVAMSGGA